MGPGIPRCCSPGWSPSPSLAGYGLAYELLVTQRWERASLAKER
jgi:hypothetical protein